ncbi:uncharacterized protein LOC112529003 [Cynara cardunculus var. scolymus]|uniref:uncharacterized protein LOC112529003 n=1 Tax=Cynara cardunculus var. scolymus TaxID=59895 RepID=UPI000D63085E|nr:uncharacterized protein LOC112529003 [Cynara cardunculus var. scolymus]
MGTEVLHPHDCFVDLPPPNFIADYTPNGGDFYSRPINNGGCRKLQPLRRLPEKMGSTPGRVNDGDDSDSYAGSGFFHSPSPRSLPLPSFFNKKQQDSMAMAAADHGGFDDSATQHLRRLLRLG